jgi:hypothetical protein
MGVTFRCGRGETESMALGSTTGLLALAGIELESIVRERGEPVFCDCKAEFRRQTVGSMPTMTFAARVLDILRTRVMSLSPSQEAKLRVLLKLAVNGDLDGDVEWF